MSDDSDSSCRSVRERELEREREREREREASRNNGPTNLSELLHPESTGAGQREAGRWKRSPAVGGGGSKLTVIPWFPERAAAHQAFRPVGQGHAAAQGGGAIEIAGRLAGRADAVGARYPRRAAGDRGDCRTREMFGRTFRGVERFLDLGIPAERADSPTLVKGALPEEGRRSERVGDGSWGGLSLSAMLTMLWEWRLPGLPSLSDRLEP
ncbi:hypothetical protein EYF80_013263 [Liparis tanakae]|uniref:Uncharacterized protein n=1 Tax=Liparis tanakae TaxID=230148 RepID=A0A4Z2IEH5_9TELE|nr:hypothetical protein EYF80_013263 [Liparis tanakae]